MRWQFFSPDVIDNLFKLGGEEIVDISWEYTRTEMHKNRSIKFQNVKKFGKLYILKLVK